MMILGQNGKILNDKGIFSGSEKKMYKKFIRKIEDIVSNDICKGEYTISHDVKDYDSVHVITVSADLMLGNSITVVIKPGKFAVYPIIITSSIPGIINGKKVDSVTHTKEMIDDNDGYIEYMIDFFSKTLTEVLDFSENCVEKYNRIK